LLLSRAFNISDGSFKKFNSLTAITESMENLKKLTISSIGFLRYNFVPATFVSSSGRRLQNPGYSLFQRIHDQNFRFFQPFKLKFNV
jgi:hypothetical protein